MMNEFDISRIIIAQGKTPVGIITHRDIMLKLVRPALMPTSIQAKQVMTTPIVIINEDASLEEAARLMEQRRVKKLPVVKDGELKGIITSMDLIRAHPKIVNLLETICGPSPSQKQK